MYTVTLTSTIVGAVISTQTVPTIGEAFAIGHAAQVARPGTVHVGVTKA